VAAHDEGIPSQGERVSATTMTTRKRGRGEAMAGTTPITKAEASRIWKGYKETKAAIWAFIDAGWDVVPEIV
jgi:hypothetical protein